MSKPNGVLSTLALTLVLLSSPSVSAEASAQDPIEGLLQQFIKVFNAGDFEVMASFYQQAATTSFNERRDEQEDRALHQKLTGMLGQLSVQKIEVQDSQRARLLVDASVPESAAEFRFTLVGEPPRIDGFSVGIIPIDSAVGHAAEMAPEADHALPDTADQDGPFAFLTAQQGIYQSQVLVQADGSLLLVWVKRTTDGVNLFVARQQRDANFSHPLQINRQSLNRYTGDEARPSVAIGPDGAIAIAWTGAKHDIMLAVGSSYGERFDAPLKLNQDQAHAARTMPSVTLSADGAAHTVWLDPRRAPKGMEEPSDLYYAIVKNGAVTESNLTARQESSVCGCCRPYIGIDDAGGFDIAFRNVSPTGYRDISRISGTVGSFSEPAPTSPPIWKLGGCPSAGPIVSHGGTLWKDASTGPWRMLWATDASADPIELFTDRDELELTHPPRTVNGRESWVLVGAKPKSLIATWNAGSWQIVRDDLPPWATSAAIRDEQLILIGNQRGRLLSAVLRW